MEEFENNKLDDIELFRKFLKLFVNDKQIEEGKKKYDKQFGKNKKESCYVTTLEAMRTNGGLDHLYDIGALSYNWFDNYAGNLFTGLISIVNCVLSGRSWNNEEYVNLAHLTMAIENESQQLGKRIIKKIREAAGVRESIFTKLPQDAHKEAEAVYELMYASDKSENTNIDDSSSKGNSSKQLDIRKG